jgi:hypothetical protein
MLRVVRTNRAVPKSASSRFRLALASAGEMPSWRAAADSPPCPAVATKISRSWTLRIFKTFLKVIPGLPSLSKRSDWSE